MGDENANGANGDTFRVNGQWENEKLLQENLITRQMIFRCYFATIYFLIMFLLLSRKIYIKKIKELEISLKPNLENRFIQSSV